MINMISARLCLVLRAAVVAILAIGSSLIFSAVSKAAIEAQSPGSYQCIAKQQDAATPPPLPVLPKPDSSTPVAPPSTTPLCPAGKVPQFLADPNTAPYAVKEPPPNTNVVIEESPSLAGSPSTVHPLSEAGEGGYYYHAVGGYGQDKWGISLPHNMSGLIGYTGQEEPVVDASDTYAHSIDQLWLSDEQAPGNSDVELGWTVDRSLPLDHDAHPHLFIYRFDGGGGTCYDYGEHYGCPTAVNCPVEDGGRAYYNGWVQVSSTEAPGEQLPINDYLDSYGIIDYGGKWWILHDDTWLGYYPTCAWADPIYGLYSAEAGGEVFSKTHSECAPTAMGNGGSGATNPNADLWLELEAEITNSGESPTEAQSTNMEGYASDPGQYSIGQYSPGDRSAHQFRFGGPACFH